VHQEPGEEEPSVKAVRVHEFGGPEILTYDEVPTPNVGPDEVLVKQEVIGVNFSDTLYRNGRYGGQLPLIPGHEGGGTIVAMGASVTGFSAGDRVVYAGQHRRGTYKEEMSVEATALVPVPPGIDLKIATAVLNQGRTAHYLTHDAHPLAPGESVLIHAAAGGVGSNLVQMAKLRGAYVYATVSSEEKSDFVRDLGADEVILYSQVDFEDEIKKRTSGEGLDVIFDALGGDFLLKSLRCLKRKGHLVTYGQTSGPPPPLEWPQRGLGSIYLSYHTGPDYVHPGEEAARRDADIFRLVQEGQLKVHIHRERGLKNAADAHRDIESRGTIGKILLIP
jgi:NADPH:quinone reductase